MFAVPENTVPDPIWPERIDADSPDPESAGLANIGHRGAIPRRAAVAGRTPAHPVRIAQEFAVYREMWASLLRYHPAQRWAGLLERTDHHEVWLLSWLPGQRTPLHDHGGATGAFTVVSGTLVERAFPLNRGAIETWHRIVAGQSRVFGPSYVHQVRNDDSDPAVSIHVYRPARSRMTVYFHPPNSEAGAVTSHDGVARSTSSSLPSSPANPASPTI